MMAKTKKSHRLKRYISLSTRKVNMFDQQGQDPFLLRWLKRLFGDITRVNLLRGVVELERRVDGNGNSEKMFETLEKVLATIERENIVGTVDIPAEYIKGTLSMFYRLIPSRLEYHRLKGDPGLVYFGGHTEQTVLALVGSPFHRYGRVKEITEEPSSDLPNMVAYLNRRFRNIVDPQLQKEIGCLDDESEDQDHGIGAIEHANAMNKDPRILMEFFAWRILDSADIEGYEGKKRLLLYSPFYVAYA